MMRQLIIIITLQENREDNIKERYIMEQLNIEINGSNH